MIDRLPCQAPGRLMGLGINGVTTCLKKSF